LTAFQSIRPSVQVNADNLTLDLEHMKPNRDFPVWHFSMVNDRPRNAAIEHAIAGLHLEGKTVVEIGTGTGLISLLFAKHGADRVISCEMNENLARVAQEIIAKTPFGNKITIINESSGVAIHRGLLPYGADIIFTETLDCAVVGEGFAAIARDIQKIAGPNSLIMPRVIKQTARIIESVSIADLNRAGDACGFDLSMLNKFSTKNYFPVHAELHEHRFLTAAKAIREYNYLNCPEPEILPFVITEGGTIHGLLSWFEADFGGAVASNEPFSKSHWHQAFHPIKNELQVKRGETIHVRLEDSGIASISAHPVF
jgi:type I protein arginine methyltransferase